MRKVLGVLALVLPAVALVLLGARSAADPADEGHFRAEVSGAVTLRMEGFAYLLSNEDVIRLQMSSAYGAHNPSRPVVSVELVWAYGLPKGPQTVSRRDVRPPVAATVSWETPDGRVHHAVPAVGTAEIAGTQSYSGRFDIIATDGSEVLRISGTFENALVAETVTVG